MLDRGTSPKKDPLASLSRKKIHGHDHLNISVFNKKNTCVQAIICLRIYMYSLYNPIFGVFTYIYIIIIRIYGLYLVISKVSTFPCPFKKQWLSAVCFFYKNEERPLPREVCK